MSIGPATFRPYFILGLHRTLFVGFRNRYAHTSCHLYQQPKKSEFCATLSRKLAQIDSLLTITTGNIEADRCFDYINGLSAAVDEAHTVSSAQILDILKCCEKLIKLLATQGDKTKLMENVWNIFKKCDAQLDITQSRALLELYISSNSRTDFSPKIFVEKIVANGLVPQVSTYQLLINYCVAMDNSREEKGQIKSAQCSEDIFSCIISEYNRIGDIDTTLDLIKLMKQSNLHPKFETFVQLVPIYAKIGDVQPALNELKELDCINPTNRLFSNVIHELYLNEPKSTTKESIAKLVKLVYRLSNGNYDKFAREILRMLSNKFGHLEDYANCVKSEFQFLIKGDQPIKEILNFYEILLAHDGVKAFTLILEACNAITSSKATNPRYYERNKILLKALQLLVANTQCKIDAQFWGDHLGPLLNVVKAVELANELKTIGISLSCVHHAVILNCLQNNKLKEAQNMYSLSNRCLSPDAFQSHLISALIKTNDVKNYTKFLRTNYDNHITIDVHAIFNNLSNIDNSLESRRNQALGQIVYATFVALPPNVRTTLLTQILKALVAEGVSISKTETNRIAEALQLEITADIALCLEQLSSGNLELKLSKKRKTNLTSQQIESSINLNENNVQKYYDLLNAYYRERNLPSYEKLLNNLIVNIVDLEIFHYERLLKLQIKYQDLNGVLSTFEKIKLINDDKYIWLDNMFRILLAQIENEQIAGAIQLLTDNNIHNQCNAYDSDMDYRINDICSRFLHKVAALGNINNLFDVFSAIINNKYVKVNTNLLRPLVKVYLDKNDVNGAIQQYERMVKFYFAVPMQNELLCRLIEDNDLANLQRVVETSSLICDPSSILLDLVFSYVECDRIREATIILNTPGLSIIENKIKVKCKIYAIDGCFENIERILQATQNVNGINRDFILEPLVNGYCAYGLVEKAMDLWASIEDNHQSINNKIVQQLQTFLKEQG